MTRIYSKSGDCGETGLIGGSRVPKDSLRIEILGTIDELNSFLGLLIAQGIEKSARSILETIQQDLLALGSDLADPREDSPLRITEKHVHALENHIDNLNAQLPPLTQFIIPGGSQAASILHIARAISRRAERVAVALQKTERITEYCLPYLNRLSDLLFVMARFQNQKKLINED